MTPFKTSHDSAESCGFVVDTGREKIGICTDLGTVTDTVHTALSGCRAVIIESNHDIGMLTRNPHYPLTLKRRIMSDDGHLSNNDCADEVAKLVKNGSTHFVLYHLSEENNTPEIALGTTKTRLLIDGMYLNRDYCVSAAAPTGNKIITV